MNTLVHADIFFFVTTIAVAVLTIALTVLIVYLVKVLRNMREITDAIKEETILVRRDIGDLRTEVRARGARAKGMMDLVGQFFGHDKKSRSKKKQN